MSSSIVVAMIAHALADTGAGLSFVSSRFVEKHSFETTVLDGDECFNVRLGNGTTVPVNQVLEQSNVTMNGHSFMQKFYVLGLPSNLDVVERPFPYYLHHREFQYRCCISSTQKWSTQNAAPVQKCKHLYFLKLDLTSYKSRQRLPTWAVHLTPFDHPSGDQPCATNRVARRWRRGLCLATWRSAR